MESPQESNDSVNSEDLADILHRLGICAPYKKDNTTTLESSRHINLEASSSENESECGDYADSFVATTEYKAHDRQGDSPFYQSKTGNDEVEVIDLLASTSDEEEEAAWTFRSVKKHQQIIGSDSDSSEEVERVVPRPPSIMPSISSIIGDISSHISSSNNPARISDEAFLGGSIGFDASLTLDKNKAAFAKKREELARTMYVKYNNIIFGNILPINLQITWNKRLATTAGLTHYKRETPADPHLPLQYTARIELSCKVVDDVSKLKRTLIHEMCHCAAWLVDHVAKPPHGPVFKKWAQRAMRSVPGIDVSTCHQYDIFYAFRWQCGACMTEYGRHSNSIDVSKKVCGSCRGRLNFLGKFTRGGSPVKARKPSAYQEYIKENFAAAKKECPPGAAASEVMKILSVKWAEREHSGSGENEISTAFVNLNI